MCDFLGCRKHPEEDDDDSDSISKDDSSRSTVTISFTESSVGSIDDEPKRYSHKKFSCFWLFFLTMTWLIVVPIGPLCFHLTPDSLKSEDKPEFNGSFKGYKANHFVQEYTSFGPRWFSHPSFYNAHEYLRNKIDSILSSIGYGSEIKYEIDIDRFDGSLRRNGISYKYKNLINIALKLSPNVNKTFPTLLVVTSYDSLFSSPGASEANYVAVLVEIIRLFCLEIPKVFRSYNSSIIFLFVGSNYNNRIGVYRFINDHPWKRNIS